MTDAASADDVMPAHPPRSGDAARAAHTIADPARPTDGDAPRRSDVERNRAAVVAAAFEVLSRQPDASMKDVATASGLGRTTLYRHFPNRDALITALFEDVFEVSRVAVDAILAQVDAPAEVFPRVAEVTVAIGARYRFLTSHQEIGAEMMRRAREDPMRDWVERGIAAGTLRPLGARWIENMLLALITAAHAEVFEGRETEGEAARKLGETMLAAFAA